MLSRIEREKCQDPPGEMAVFIASDANTRKALDAEEDDDEEEVRDQWTRGLDFVLSLIGYAVGVSNLWRFPYLTLRNGGGAFLIPFFFFMTLAGIPLFYLEVCLGQFSGISSMFVWRMCPLFKGVGYGMVIVSGMACIYYNAVLSWVIYYLVNSFYSELPWAHCGNWWNTPTCVDSSGANSSLSSGDNNTFFNDNTSLPLLNGILDFHSLNSSSFSNDSLYHLWNSNFSVPFNESGLNASFLCNWNSSFCENTEDKVKTAAEEFWQYNVLRKTEGLEDLGGLQMHNAICLLVAWVLVCLCLIKGVKSLGKVVYVTALLPYALLTIFLIRGCMLPGAVDGIIFYVKPDFEKLKSFTVWIEACVQVFYSLGPAWGGLITMASFNKFHNNCLRDVMIASLADGLTSFYGGFVIFAVVGFMAKEANVTVTEVATQGPGLALVAYPEAISKLPIPQLWAVMFFFMLLLLGLDSQFGMFETVICGLIDAFPKQLRKKRIMLTFGLALISYCVSLPIATRGGIYVFTLLDWFVAAFCVMLTSLIECIIIGWLYGVDKFCDDIELMIGRRPGIYMKVCWTVVTPLVMLVAFIFTCAKYTLPVYDGYVFPTHANAIGFLISVIPLIPIPAGMAYVLFKEKGTFSERLYSSVQPSPEWGPGARRYKAMYEDHKEERKHRPYWLKTLFRRNKF
ncbi:sodium- and chloride-dependent betaine transporter isoform X2 [Aplysia californica]|uniref:Transporter n=1 Tax=Aplysia californica TaxID=6500 RepID=A0ABM0K0A6_APLCA|nr:sodium- and chloride-dependent betaine transporter isoform X2 [Aplysia californica]XP_005105729.1 sodium- and chloride-dependent betaine transporter isoform X2 [Aplysia californica]